MKKIELGDYVQHKYTGFKGIAFSRTSYISGCDRIAIQPKIKKDGTLNETYSFDEPEIIVIKKNKVKNKTKDKGGWQPEVKHFLKK